MALSPSQQKKLSTIIKAKVFEAKVKAKVKAGVTREQQRQRQPSQPGGSGFVGPVKHSPQPSPSSEERQAGVNEGQADRNKVEINKILDSLEGQPVRVTYKTPSGYSKSVQTTGFNEKFRLPFGSELISVSRLQPSGGRGRPILVSSQDVMGKPSLHQQFRDTKQVPDWYSSQVKIPNIIKDVGATEKYLQYSYGLSIGHWEADAAKQQATIDRMITKNMTPTVAKKYYDFNGKTWQQAKKDEPALELRKTSNGFETYMDTTAWQKGQKNIFGEAASYLVPSWDDQLKRMENQLFKSSDNVKPYTIGSSQEYSSKVAAGRQYTLTKKWVAGDYPGLALDVVSSPGVSIPLSIFGGKALGFGMAKFAASGVGSRVLFNIGKHGVTAGGLAKTGVTAGFTTIAAVDIAPTAFTAIQTGQYKPLAYKVVPYAALGYGGYKGFKTGYYKGLTAPAKTGIVKKEAMVFMDDSGQVQAIGGQKYINLFGKQISFGKKWAAIPKSNTIGFGSKPKWPYVPSGLSKSPTIFSNPPLGKPLVPVSYKGSYTFMDGKGWQPKTGLRWLPSTKVWPKPLPHPRAYEHHFFTFVYIPRSIVSVTSKPFVMKSFKPKMFTVKDVLKPTKDTKLFSTTSQGQQVILEPPKTKTVTKTTTEQITSPLSKDIVVPESLLKPKLKFSQYQLQQTKLKHPFEQLKQYHTTQKTQLRKLAKSFLTIPGVKTATGYRSIQTTAYRSDLRFDNLQLFAPLQLQSQAQTQVFGTTQMKAQGKNIYQLPKTVYPQSKYDYTLTPIPSFKPFHPKSSTPKKPNVLILPSFDGDRKYKKRRPMELLGRGYRHRRWKVPTMESMITGGGKNMDMGMKKAKRNDTNSIEIITLSEFMPKKRKTKKDKYDMFSF